MTQKFQIGSDEDQYVFGPADMEVNQAPVYMCCRGLHGKKNMNKKARIVLWLAKGEDGHWIARQAPKNSEEPLQHGPSLLKTKFPLDDITIQGDVAWQYFDIETKKWVDFTYPFKTRTWIEQ